MSQSWSIVILCYNEEGNIKIVIDDVFKTIEKMSVNDFEVIIVDDGSIDNSQKAIEGLMEKYPKIVLKSHSSNLGIGQAIRTGLLTADKENIVVIAGDGQFNLKDLVPHTNIKENTIVSFYRVDKGPYTAFRHFISNFNRWLNKYLLGADITDVNWVKIYKKANLRSIDLELKSSLVETEIVTKLLKKSISLEEYQTVYLPRLHGEPKGASFKVVSMAIMELIKLIYILRIRRLFLGK